MNTVLVGDAEVPCGRRALALSWDSRTIISVYVEAIAEGQPSGVLDCSWLYGTKVTNAVKKWARTLGTNVDVVRASAEEVRDAAEGAL